MTRYVRSAEGALCARANLVADWIRYFAPETSVEAMVVEKQDRLVAALPLYLHAVGRILPTAHLPHNNWAYNGALLLNPSVDTVPIAGAHQTE